MTRRLHNPYSCDWRSLENQVGLFKIKRSSFSTIFYLQKKNPKHLVKYIFNPNNIKIGPKTQNQPKIKITFGFKSIIVGKFKGKQTCCTNVSHQKEFINTKTTCYHG